MDSEGRTLREMEMGRPNKVCTSFCAKYFVFCIFVHKHIDIHVCVCMCASPVDSYTLSFNCP